MTNTNIATTNTATATEHFRVEGQYILMECTYSKATEILFCTVFPVVYGGNVRMAVRYPIAHFKADSVSSAMVADAIAHLYFDALIVDESNEFGYGYVNVRSFDVAVNIGNGVAYSGGLNGKFSVDIRFTHNEECDEIEIISRENNLGLVVSDAYFTSLNKEVACLPAQYQLMQHDENWYWAGAGEPIPTRIAVEVNL